MGEDTNTEQGSPLQPSPQLPEGDTFDDSVTEQFDDPGVENPTICQQWHEARFILSIKEQHVISQAAVDHIMSSTTTLVSTLLDNITANVYSTDPQELLHEFMKYTVHDIVSNLYLRLFCIGRISKRRLKQIAAVRMVYFVISVMAPLSETWRLGNLHCF